MKLTVTLQEASQIIADRHCLNSSNVEIVGVPASAPVGPRMQGPEPLLTMQDVVFHIRSGNKISAIKAFRTTFNVGLKEAKDVVEHLADNIARF